MLLVSLFLLRCTPSEAHKDRLEGVTKLVNQFSYCLSKQFVIVCVCLCCVRSRACRCRKSPTSFLVSVKYGRASTGYWIGIRMHVILSVLQFILCKQSVLDTGEGSQLYVTMYFLIKHVWDGCGCERRTGESGGGGCGLG